MNKYKSLVACLLMVSASVTSAEGFDWRKLYIGAGYGNATVPGVDDAESAAQVLIGYTLGKPRELLDPERYEFGLELGHINVSSVDWDGTWLTPTATYYLGNNVGLMIRLGYETGEDSGPIGALGVDYRVDDSIHTRVEVVDRQEESALFLNVIYRP